MITEQMLKEWAEGYRRVAFPRKRIRTRDEQNRALVARGSYHVCRELLRLAYGNAPVPFTWKQPAPRRGSKKEPR